MNPRNMSFNAIILVNQDESFNSIQKNIQLNLLVKDQIAINPATI